MPSVTISIDLEPPEGETPPREADEAVVRALVDQLGEAGIAATWFAAEPATSTALHQALDANCGHEAAIAMVGNWSGHENGRSRFATEFLRRKRAAERANIAVTALTTSEGTPPESFELLVRHGISAIRTVGSKTARRNTRSEFPGTTRLRFGLWQIDEVSQVASGAFSTGILPRGESVGQSMRPSPTDPFFTWPSIPRESQASGEPHSTGFPRS